MGGLQNFWYMVVYLSYRDLERVRSLWFDPTLKNISYAGVKVCLSTDRAIIWRPSMMDEISPEVII